MDNLEKIYNDMLTEKKRNDGNTVMVEISLDVLVHNVPDLNDDIDFVKAEDMVYPLVKKIKSLRLPGMEIDRVGTTGSFDGV